jgi:hypothetical protein
MSLFIRFIFLEVSYSHNIVVSLRYVPLFYSGDYLSCFTLYYLIVQILQSDATSWFILVHRVRQTGYGLDGRGSNPEGGDIFRTCPDRPWGPPSLLYNGYWIFTGGRKRPERDADPSPLLMPRSKTEYSYTSTLPKGLRGL